MHLPRPQLSLRLLPLMDIIFILLAFFMILPHGAQQRKTALMPSLENLKNTDELVEVVEDVPFHVQILPERKVKIRSKVSPWRWVKSSQTISSKKDLNAFLKKIEGLLKEAEGFRKELQKKWDQAKASGKKLSRSPKILIQMEIHSLATIWLPFKLRDFFQTLTGEDLMSPASPKNPKKGSQYILTLRRM